MHLAFLTLAVFLLMALVDGYGSNYYCSANLCPHGGPNVGCNPPPLSGGRYCYGKSPSVVPLSAGVQAHILHLHNAYRSRVASGYQYPLPPAANMYTMVWDDELAAQAGNNARSCEFRHDQCRNTPSFLYAGQNLSILKYYGQSFTIKDIISSFVAGWYNEYQYMKPSYVERFPRSQLYKIGHFTQLVSDRAWKVGCAMQKWTEAGRTIVYLVCNYSFTNIVNQKVYTKGSSGSKCKTGLNPNYPGLCRSK